VANTLAVEVPPSASQPPYRFPTRRGRQSIASLLLAPSVIVLAMGSAVPLVMTLWLSAQHYNLISPDLRGFAGFGNYSFLINDPAFWDSLRNTLTLVGSVLLVTVLFGTLLAVLFDQNFPGRGVARLFAIAPFFVMPTVGALIWKNLLMHPVYGVFGVLARDVGGTPIDWFANHPMLSLVIILSWEWLPFSLLILLTAMQSLDQEQREAARMDGAGAIAQFAFITLPHLRRAISVVIMMETIFLLAVFAEIFVTTAGGPGTATTNLAFLIYGRALLQFDIGGASAGGVVAIVLANVVAAILARLIAPQLEA
jgi:sorbitol/mannitol transport system permease protein